MTKIDTADSKQTGYFPDLDAAGLEVVWESELQEEKGLAYRFLRYERRSGEVMSEIIIGRNAVLEALKNNREIEKITVARGAEGSVKQITR